MTDVYMMVDDDDDKMDDDPTVPKMEIVQTTSPSGIESSPADQIQPDMWGANGPCRTPQPTPTPAPAPAPATRTNSHSHSQTKNHEDPTHTSPSVHLLFQPIPPPMIARDLISQSSGFDEIGRPPP